MAPTNVGSGTPLPADVMDADVTPPTTGAGTRIVPFAVAAAAIRVLAGPALGTDMTDGDDVCAGGGIADVVSVKAVYGGGTWRGL